MTSDQKYAAEYDSRPRISVIVLTMNRKDILARCLNSVFQQTFADREVIVVDNGSTDKTEEMLQSMFPDVRYFRLEKNAGVPVGRNHGVSNAGGEICLFIDDDAYFTDENALARVSSYFHTDDALGLIALSILTPDLGVEEYKSIPRVDKERINGDYECAYFCGAGFAVRRDLFVAAGQFWEPLFFLVEELDLSYRIMERGHRMVRAYNIAVVHDETPVNRVPGKWIYFGLRNRLWVAIRNLPWGYVATHLVLWSGYYVVMAAKHRQPGFFFRALRDMIAGFPAAVATRHRLSPGTILRLKQCSGRLYY